MQNIEELKDKHKGESIVLIGNGPSLNTTNFNLIKDEIQSKDLFIYNQQCYQR